MTDGVAINLNTPSVKDLMTDIDIFVRFNVGTKRFECVNSPSLLFDLTSM